eukprot:s749_g6.t1
MPTLSELKRRRPKPRMEKWWEKSPTLPGEACTATQRRLADEKDHYTGVCRLLQDVSAYTELMQTSFHIVAKVKFNNMNANYPNIFHGVDGNKVSFTSHGLGPAYGGKKGQAAFYLQTSTNIGPHGRGINYDGGWLPSKIRAAGTALIVDGQRIEAQLKDVEKDSSKFVMKPCKTILVGKAKGGSDFDGEIGDVQIFTHGKQVFGPSLGSYDLAQGIVPTGSSDSHWGRFYGATDGLEDRVWHSTNYEYPSYLTLEFPVPSKIDGMKILTPHNHLNYGFKTLEIFRSSAAIIASLQ